MDHDIHAIQGEILKRLLLRETARFSDLRPKGVASDQFSFHVKQLVERGVVEKNDHGLYLFTAAGKEYANRFDTDSGPVKNEKQAKLTVVVIASHEMGGVREYVMQQRLKQPFFGFCGFITGKIKMGESVLDAGTRELQEETGLSASVQHNSTYHERIYSPSGELFEDKYFFVCSAQNATGELVEEFAGGKNQWVSREEFLSNNIFYDIADLLALTEAGAPVFSEKSYAVEKY